MEQTALSALSVGEGQVLHRHLPLRALGYLPYTGPLTCQTGLLNDNRLITNAAGDLFCLRTSKPKYRDLVSDYLRALYSLMGVYDRPARLRFRTMREQVDFMHRCHSCALNVPPIIASGTDWMITRYIPGTLLKDYLGERQDAVATNGFLDGLLHAHANRLILLDRWGGNELVTEQGTIVFLDFDIELELDASTLSQYAATLDLAVALRTCLLWTQQREQMLTVLVAWLQCPPPSAAAIYDRALLVRLLGSACDFYDSPARTALVNASAPFVQHQSTNQYVQRLIYCLTGDANP